MAYPTDVRVYVDFAHGPWSVSSTWTDVTSYVTGRVRYEFGRSSAVDDFQPGKGSYTLMNDDGRFDPSNASGPHYGNLKPRRRTMILATVSGVTDTIAYGWIEGWPQRWEGRKTAYVDITFTDAFSLFNTVEMPESIWDWRVDNLNPLMWYKLGDSKFPACADSSGNNLPGEWRVFESVNAPPWGAPMPKAVGEKGRTGSVIPASDRQAISWAALQAEVGQPLGGITGAPRTPVFAPQQWAAGALPPDTSWAFAMWVLYRQAFPVDIRNIYSSTSPMEQILITWGDPDDRSWQLGIGTDAKLVWRFRADSVTSAAATAIGPSLDDGQPHFILNSKFNDTLTVRIDGVSIVNISLTTVKPYVSAFPAVGVATATPKGLQSTLGDIVFWNVDQGLTNTQALWAAGKYGSTSSGVTVIDTDTAFNQGFTAAEIATNTDWTFSDGLLVTETISGQSFADYLRKLAATEQGLLFCDQHGFIRFHGRKWQQRTNSATVQWTLGDTAGSTLGYAELNYRDAVDGLQNDVTVNFPGGSERAVNAASVADYGPTSGSIDTFLASASDAQSIAAFRAWKHGTPPATGIIPDRMVIQPNTTAEFEMVCSVSIADRIQVVRTRPNGTTLTDDFWVESIAHDFDAELGGEWTTTIGLSLADWPAAAFVLNTSTLNSTDALWI